MANVFHAIQIELNINKPRQILFHAATGLTQIPKCSCGRILSWHDDLKRYRFYCSKSCAAKYSVAKKKEKNKARYGVEWHSQLPDWSDKVKATSIKKFGVEHYSKTTAHKKRTIEANQKKFKVNYPAQSIEIQNQIKSTCLRKYGVDNPAKLTENIASSKITCVEKYGVSNPAQRHYSVEALTFLTNDILFAEECEKSRVSELAKKYNISVKPIYDKINELGIEIPRLNISTFEAEVANYISASYNGTIVKNDWAVLKNKQLDLLLPDLKIAFECNGTYWHSEDQGRGKKYHDDKTTRCNYQGITLIHIWEHDWREKNEIVKSMIASKISATPAKIYARKTEAKLVDASDAANFFSKTHLQGRVYRKSINIGLCHNEEIVALMSFGKTRFDKKYQWELLRFSNKLNCSIIGGASKMFRYFVDNYKPESVVSFANRMHSTGKVYDILGFSHVGKSQPGYKYTKNFIDIFDRQKFQKHKLKKILPIFDETLSESLNMKNNGYTRLWDCGNEVYVWQNIHNR